VAAVPEQYIDSLGVFLEAIIGVLAAVAPGADSYLRAHESRVGSCTRYSTWALN
jgi:hypothetical protein